MKRLFSEEEKARQLMVSAAIGDMERLRCLVDLLEVPVDSTYQGKPSALCYAVMRGHIPMIDYLLDRGANINYSDTLGQTPLIYAALTGHAAIVQYLLHQGACAHWHNKNGDTALSLSRRKGACHKGVCQCFHVLEQHIQSEAMQSYSVY